MSIREFIFYIGKKGGDSIISEKAESDYKLTKVEKETIILWNEEDEPIVIYTFDAGLIARLNKASAKFRDAIKVEPPDKWGCVTAKIEKPFLRISFVAPLTDAQRAVMSASSFLTSIISPFS